MKPFDITAYHAELVEVASRLEPVASRVSVRGDGAGRFVFAESPRGAVELSKTEDLRVFVELWPPDSDEPAGEETHPTYESALVSAVSWLRAAEPP